MEEKIEQNKIENRHPLKGEDLFFFVLFAVLVPILVIILFVYGLIATKAPISFIGWVMTSIGILLIWRGWFLFMKKVNRDLNDPEQGRIMDEQIKLLSFLDQRTFRIKPGKEKHFQAPEGRVFSTASKMSAMSVSLLGILIYIASNIGGYSPDAQQNIILVGGYVIIIGFIVLLVQVQKGSK